MKNTCRDVHVMFGAVGIDQGFGEAVQSGGMLRQDADFGSCVCHEL